ncbi:MAG: replicative DNA helicase [Bacteroidia bacterium]|nr:replicative DNA helicase [Bacteroidia bacterium]
MESSQVKRKQTTTDYGKVKQKVIDEIGKLPPQAPELEEAVIGALMLEKDAYFDISEILRPESFYNDHHRYIFEAITQLALQRKPIDMLTVGEQLKSMGKLEDAGGQIYLAELTSKVASATNVVYHSQIIAQKYLARELIRVATDIQTKAFDEKTDVDELMQNAEGQLFEVTQRNIKKDVTPIGEILSEAINRIQLAGQQENGYTGIPSGFKGLDAITNGWQQSTLNIIAARPAMGKTAFVLSMAKNMAVDYQKSVAIFSLEMSNLELVNRLVVNVSEIEGEKIKRGKLAEYEWMQLQSRTTYLVNAPIYIDDTPSLSVFELCSKSRRLKNEHHIDCIIIDYLQLMNASGMSYGSREQEVSIISRSLKALAKELNIPIIALSQLNRGVEGRTGDEKRPQLSDLRESGAIEQDADMVLMIHRPEYYKIMEDKDHNSTEGIAEIIIAKHRSGSVGDVRLRFKKEFIKFTNLDENNDNNYFDTPAGWVPNNDPLYNDPLNNDPLNNDVNSLT